MKKRWLSMSLLMLLSLHLSMIYAANPVITLSLKNVTLKEFFKAVESQSEFSFMYNARDIDANKRISVNVKRENLNKILTTVLRPQGIVFEISGKQIVLSKGNKATKSAQPSGKMKITGVVTGDDGEPVIGANIVLQGTTTGTITDIDGRYTIEAPANGSLNVSYIGYTTQTLPIGGQQILNVSLGQDAKLVEEVVVVGYGIQKKSSVTSAIDVVSGKTIEKMPVSNITQSLQGTVPGLIIVDNGGKPGSSPSINIRGIGTLGATEPLVIIDGVPTGMGDFNTLNPQDIENISVLKDASSAAIYGSRAANGVLVVTTKKGRTDRKPIIDASYIYSTQSPTKVPEFIDSWEYAELRNETLLNSNKNPQFSAPEIAMMKDGSNPDYYANTKWWKSAVKPNNNMHIANLRISGGTGKTTYMVSGGYTRQDGLINYTDFEKYNLRTNLSMEVLDNLHASANLSYYRDSRQVPDHYDSFFGSVINMAPYLPVKRSDGNWGHLNNEDTNPVAWITDGGHKRNHENNLLMNYALDWEIIKGLKAKGQVAYNLWDLGYTSVQRTIRFVNEDGSEKFSNNPNGNSREMAERSQLTLQATLDYEKSFGRNNIKALVGFTDEHYKSQWVGGWRWYLPDNEMEELNGALGTADAQGNWGSSDEWRMRSYFGRLNYDWDGKYMIEGNFRYDGSSRLAPGHQYTFFPSGSIGWRLSEEGFMESTRSVLDNLKLRASYGSLGNQNIPLYQYADVIGTNNKEYMFGHILVPGSYMNRLPNYNLTWEVSTILDFGADFGLFNNRLNGSFDWYKKTTDGILLNIPVSAVVGIPVAMQNAGKMTNWGWELQLGWRDQVDKFKYSASLSLSDQQNKVLDLRETGPFKYNRTIIEEGKAMNTLYGYIADGFYTSDEEVKSSPCFEGYADQLRVGDIKYRDISGPNGVPDNKIDSHDKTHLGWSAPRYMYGLDLTGEWKGFDLRLFFQGVGKRDEYVFGDITSLSGGLKNVRDDRWNPNSSVEENLNNAKLPRLTEGQGNNYEVSSFYVQNAAYLRLKNIQLGYTLPRHISKKASLERVRFYVSSNNLFTLTSFPYLDPEGAASASYYPQLRTFSFGFDITIGKN